MHLADHAVLEGDRRARADVERSMTLRAQVIRKRHAEARGVRCRDELLGIGAARVLESSRVTEGRVAQHAARRADRSASRLEVASPSSRCRSFYSRHDLILHLRAREKAR